MIVNTTDYTEKNWEINSLDCGRDENNSKLQLHKTEFEKRILHLSFPTVKIKPILFYSSNCVGKAALLVRSGNYLTQTVIIFTGSRLRRWSDLTITQYSLLFVILLILLSLNITLFMDDQKICGVFQEQTLGISCKKEPNIFPQGKLMVAVCVYAPHLALNLIIRPLIWSFKILN